MSRMQPEYLALLSDDVRAFVLEVEAAAGVAIDVVPDAKLNNGGPLGRGTLKVNIDSHGVEISAPTNGYFPDGAVRHEVLHVHRFHVQGVPRIALADAIDWAPTFEEDLVRVDNALEHLVIVPIELAHHPDRREHWEAVMAEMWQAKLPAAPSDLARRSAVCLHWTFLSHVLPGSPTMETARAFMQRHGLNPQAEAFAHEALLRLTDKEAVAQLFFDHFVEIPRGRAALEYINSVTGTRQAPIPG